MTSNCYIIDTSSLVELNRKNPLDVYPSVWNKMEHLITENRLIAPKEVLNEVIKNDDQLAKWIKKQKKMFKEPNEKQIESVQQILKEYPSLIKIDREFDADPWIIALAKDLSTTSQQTLFQIKRIIVTEEKLRGNKIRIPFISNKLFIESIDIITMFRMEKWKF